MIGVEDLRADCSRCTGLCCVAPAFARSSDFAFDKPSGTPCRNLGEDSRCGVHSELRELGMVGCTVFDCLGAGQVIAATGDWRTSPELARAQFDALPVLRALHELLRYLDEAVGLDGAAAGLPGVAGEDDQEGARGAGPRTTVSGQSGSRGRSDRTGASPAGADPTGSREDGAVCAARGDRAGPLGEELTALRSRIAGLAALPPAALAGVDVDGCRREANPLLSAVSETVRGQGPDRRGADLIGARLRGADLRNASLRGALLLGADLRNADLRGADLTGADLRGAKLAGADLRGVLFLLPPQLAAARGDRTTRLPDGHTAPPHWV
ncbi:pentapeptide repeat-containing protein [Pseudonocardia ailaonensis]|uniref:Pentapeptide repeat-containing protein n=1 Tax=Pseudonocardia ailaonensis TaxID=367279 RepID=A0ABN2NKV2_9PSEU